MTLLFVVLESVPLVLRPSALLESPPCCEQPCFEG